jgi:hypothetical protein
MLKTDQDIRYKIFAEKSIQIEKTIIMISSTCAGSPSHSSIVFSRIGLWTLMNLKE